MRDHFSFPSCQSTHAAWARETSEPRTSVRTRSLQQERTGPGTFLCSLFTDAKRRRSFDICSHRRTREAVQLTHGQRESPPSTQKDRSVTPRDPGSFASSRWPWATWLSGTQKAAGPLTRCSPLYLSLKPHLFSLIVLGSRGYHGYKVTGVAEDGRMKFEMTDSRMLGHRPARELGPYWSLRSPRTRVGIGVSQGRRTFASQVPASGTAAGSPARPGGGRASVCAGCGRVRDVTVSAPAAACEAPQRRRPTPRSAGSRRTRSASWSARSGTAERALRTDCAPPHRSLSPCRKLAVPQKHPSTVSQRPRGKAPPTSRSGTGALGTGYRGKRRCIQTRFCCGRHR